MTKAIGIIDMEIDFCEGGKLAVRGGNRVAKAIADYLKYDAEEYSLWFATKDWHIDPGPHFSDNPDFVDSWPAHCEAGSLGADFHPALDNMQFDCVIYKGQYAAAYSGFEGNTDSTGSLGGETLGGILTSCGIIQVDLVGLAFDYCVKATGIDAVKFGYETTILADYTAAVHNGRDDVAKTIRELQDAGVRVR